MAKVTSFTLIGICAFTLLTGCATWSKKENYGHHSFSLQRHRTTGSFEEVANSAYNGDPDAEYALGYMYYYGKNGAPRDPDMGQEWIQKAAAQGQPQAVQAMTLLEKAAHPQAGRAYMQSRPKPDNARKRAMQAKGWDYSDASSTTSATPKKANVKVAQTKPKYIPTKALNGYQLTRDENKLLSEPSGYYTLQLMGQRHEAEIQSFVRHHQLFKNTKVYHTFFRGKDWYVLTYGIYRSGREAKLALKRLPHSIRQRNPWVKPISLVQAEILENKSKS